MRLATRLADRMISALVPQKTAAAGCSGVFYLTCGPCVYVKQLHGYYQEQKQCNWHYNCTYTCSSCFAQSC